MIRDITIGQYYQTDSVIHRLDPRFKIIITAVGDGIPDVPYAKAPFSKGSCR